MADKFKSENFGPVTITTIAENADTNLVAQNKIKVAVEKHLMKTGNERIKEKVKAIWRVYRKAVTEGRRSGSGRLVCDHWDTFRRLPSCCFTAKQHFSSLESNNKDTNLPGSGESNSENIDDVNLNSSSTSAISEDNTVSKDRKRPVNEGSTQKFVNNKRNMMKKKLSAHQHVQLFLKVALEDLKVKECMVQALTQSN